MDTSGDDANRNYALTMGKSKIPGVLGAPVRLAPLTEIFNGADVNARDKSDRSALHCAVQSNWKEIVELLLDKGADINAKRKEKQV